MIKIQSKEGKSCEVLLAHARLSGLVRASLELDAHAQQIEALNASEEVLQEVILWLNFHKGVAPPLVEKPLRSKVMKDVCHDPFDATFIDRIGEDMQKLYDLILAANYLDIKPLLHLAVAKVASLIKGEPLEKIASILSVRPMLQPADVPLAQ